MAHLTKNDIEHGLQSIDQRAKLAGVLIELSVYGGAVLSLVFNAREITRDVDAVLSGDPTLLRRFAAEVAEEQGWPGDWLNDGVKAYRSSKERMRLYEKFSAASGGGLRVIMPTPEYLFAMKCMAMRPEGIEGSHDISDIELLADAAMIEDSAHALSLIEQFYPASRIPPKVSLGVEEIMQRVVARRLESGGTSPEL
jgi:hypothetical protein